MQCFSIAATHDAQVMPCTCKWHLAKSFLSNTTWSSFWALDDAVLSGLADFDTLGAKKIKIVLVNNLLFNFVKTTVEPTFGNCRSHVAPSLEQSHNLC